MAFRAVWQAGSAFVVACLVGAPGIGVPLSVAVAVCGLASFGVRRAMPVWPPVTALPAFGWQQAMAGVGGLTLPQPFSPSSSACSGPA